MSASITICLCTYNGTAYLPEQLASLSSQTRPADEIVIGDDGSKDGTVRMVERWAESVPTSVLIERRSDPLGHVANLESVLRRASSDFVFICDQDDRWSPEKLERMALALEDAPLAGGAFCDSTLIDEASVPVTGSLWRTLHFSAAEQASVAGGGGLEVLLRRNVVAGHALCLRRDRLELLLPFPDIDHADWWLALGLLLDGGLVPLSQKLVGYRLHRVNAVGLRSRTSVADRMARTDPRTRSKNDAALLEGLVSRLDHVRPGSLNDDGRALLQAKISHSLSRASLPPGRPSRIVPVAKLLASGNYGRLSNGWRSALIDLMAPSR